MLSVRRPSPDRVSRFLAAERDLPFTYKEVGYTRDERTAGAAFDHDHNRVQLGRGAATFARAKELVRAWTMFPAWTAIAPATPIETGRVLAVMIHVFGVWFTNSARIAYVIDEPRRFGFAYGTLPGHVEHGEERFLVEHLDDDTVWYDLRAFSRPRMWAARVGYPLTRRLQKRFARDSKAAMARGAR